MKLIAILICLALQRYAHISGSFSQKWFEIYLGWFKPLFGKLNKWLSLIVVILPIVLVLFLVAELLIWQLFGLFSFLFSALILFLCIDARDLRRVFADYFEASEKQDSEHARSLLKPLADEYEFSIPQNQQELNRTVTKLIFLKESQHMFMVLFWFAVFGIYGAAIYYMLMLVRKFTLVAEAEYAGISEVAITLQNLLDWIPIRILGLSYALAGHFMRGFSYCWKSYKLGLKDNKNFVINSGLTALDVNPEDSATSNVTENYNALSLIDRSIIIWLVAILFVAIGMLM